MYIENSLWNIINKFVTNVELYSLKVSDED